jgi:protein TonB
MDCLRPPPGDIADVVLGVSKPERRGRLLVAVCAAAVAHALVLLAANRSTMRLHARTQASPTIETEIVDIALPRPAPPTPDRAPSKTREAHAAAAARSQPARAATVLVQQPDPGAAVDLTSDTVVIGRANAYAGGITSSTGTGPAAAQQPSTTGEREPRSVPATPDRSTPVLLRSENWSCPWPAEADAQQIDEQTVVLRVVVDSDGAPRSATVLADPGHGFGPAAAACAMRTRFTPAHGNRGGPIGATSPPIRVRFTR